MNASLLLMMRQKLLMMPIKMNGVSWVFMIYHELVIIYHEYLQIQHVQWCIMSTRETLQILERYIVNETCRRDVTTVV